MRCGYPAASIRERIYADYEGKRFALLLYTASPDAEGTLGGLVQEARRVEDHLRYALDSAALCSNDPVCAEHVPGQSMEERWLHGAACHGCALIAETSCEMRNEYLDRALVAPALARLGSRVLRRAVIDALLALPAHVRSRLSLALESGQLVPPYSAVAVRSTVGGDHQDAILEVLTEWERMGVSPDAGVVWLNSLARAADRAPAPDFVWTGPEVVGLHARDTRRVYEELIGSARRSIWVCSYAFFDGPRAFKTLASRMEAQPWTRSHASTQHRTPTRGHHGCRRRGPPIRGHVLGRGVAGRRAPEGVLRSCVPSRTTALAACSTRRPWWRMSSRCSSPPRT